MFVQLIRTPYGFIDFSIDHHKTRVSDDGSRALAQLSLFSKITPRALDHMLVPWATVYAIAEPTSDYNLFDLL